MIGDDGDLPFSFDTKRVAVMRRPVVAIALLRSEWITIPELMIELDCCERAAKNLILWARVHWYLQSRRRATDLRPMDAATPREYRLAAPTRRHVRLGACAFACCRDLRGGDDVVIYGGPSSVHMWPSPAAERSPRSAVMTLPGQWFLVGRDAPSGAHSMQQALRWVACDARPSEGDAYDGAHDDDGKRAAMRLVERHPTVSAGDAGQRRTARRRVHAPVGCISIHAARRLDPS